MSEGQPPVTSDQSQSPKHEYSQGRANYVLANMFLLAADFGLVYGAYAQENWSALGVTAVGVIVGIYNIASQYNYVDGASQSHQKPAVPSGPTRIRKEGSHTTLDGVGGTDPIDWLQDPTDQRKK